MKKRGIGLLLGIMVMSSTLTGCGNRETSESNMTSETAEKTTDAVPEEDAGETEDTALTEGMTQTIDDKWKTEAAEAGGEAADETAEADLAESVAEDYADIDYFMDEKKYMQSSKSGCYEYPETECYEEWPDAEEYNAIDEMGFTAASINPLSTFSADVDTASYSNLRRMIEDGYRLEDIPDGAVRIEELLNYFDYDYAGPKKR